MARSLQRALLALMASTYQLAVFDNNMGSHAPVTFDRASMTAAQTQSAPAQ